MTEGKEEKTSSYTVFLHKILSSLVVQLHWQRTEDSSVKATLTRCRKAGRKQMSLVDGWREAGWRAVGSSSWPEGTCKIHYPVRCALVRATCLWILDLTMKQDCLDPEHSSKTQQAPESPTLLAETNMDNLVVSFYRLLLAQFLAGSSLLLVTFLLCIFPENFPPVTWPVCRNLHPLNNKGTNPHRHTTFLLLPLRAFFKGRPRWQLSILARNGTCWNFYKCEISHLQ